MSSPIEPTYHTLGKKIEPTERRHILPWAAGCVTCAQHMPGEMMPPHDASPRCESGKRNHCTCDTCF
jgi:hypothetical protein